MIIIESCLLTVSDYLLPINTKMWNGWAKGYTHLKYCIAKLSSKKTILFTFPSMNARECLFPFNLLCQFSVLKVFTNLIGQKISHSLFNLYFFDYSYIYFIFLHLLFLNSLFVAFSEFFLFFLLICDNFW